ncbi:MAG: quinolinate synthase [bacterium]|nr:quinolinate synthase [bacterium]
MENQQFYITEINRLRKERNAVILAHNYQLGEIQDIADFVGDSLGLSIIAAQTPAKVVIFCGVHFMAESAAILCPEKTVILPEINAGCPLADMATAEQIQKVKFQLSNSKTELVVVSYVNTTAAVKSVSDICCTSGNAVKVVQSIPRDKSILFVPDKNLGSWVAEQTEKRLGKEARPIISLPIESAITEPTFILWDGYCPTHEYIFAEEVMKLKEQHSNAEFVCHPECRPEVRKLADKIASTEGIVQYVKESKGTEFIIGTEKGILHRLQKDNPEKKFYLASDKLLCPNMKITTLKSVYQSLLTMEPVITVPPDIQQKAKSALDKMIQIK